MNKRRRKILALFPWWLRSLHHVAGWIATLGPVGHLPASGTIATALTLPFIYFLFSLISYTAQLVFITLLLIAGIHFTWVYLKYIPDADPREVVIDEVIGYSIIYVGVPISFKLLLIGFALFRFFDITKILGVGYLERVVPGARGVVVDDIFAGILVRLIFFLFLYV